MAGLHLVHSGKKGRALPRSPRDGKKQFLKGKDAEQEAKTSKQISWPLLRPYVFVILLLNTLVIFINERPWITGRFVFLKRV